MSTNSPAPKPWYCVAWRYARGCVIFVVVVFHLFLLVVRNPLDLWYKDIRDWTMRVPAWDVRESDEDPPPPTWWDRYSEEFKLVDRFTWKYANLVGCEQGWSMFTPPVARGANFLAVRLEFRDGTSELLLSDNEPVDPTRYFRLGGWQTRKLEDYLMWPPNDLASDPKSRSLWENNASHAIHKWRAASPDDSREVARVVFLRRRIAFPKPGETYDDPDARTEEDFATFDAEGRLLP